VVVASVFFRETPAEFIFFFSFPTSFFLIRSIPQCPLGLSVTRTTTRAKNETIQYLVLILPSSRSLVVLFAPAALSLFFFSGRVLSAV
jgi:hypothetical protein